MREVPSKPRLKLRELFRVSEIHDFVKHAHARGSHIGETTSHRDYRRRRQPDIRRSPYMPHARIAERRGKPDESSFPRWRPKAPVMFALAAPFFPSQRIRRSDRTFPGYSRIPFANALYSTPAARSRATASVELIYRVPSAETPPFTRPTCVAQATDFLAQPEIPALSA